MGRACSTTRTPGIDSLQRLCGWYATPLGKALEDVELETIRESLTTLFGYHLLVVEPPWQTSPLEASRIPHRMIMSAVRGRHASLLGSPSALPATTDSLDLVILPHTLEFVSHPHEVLREVDRCLIPEGHVVIHAFSPYGIWGLWRLLFGWRRRLPWTGRFISQTRLHDWLALLGFDTVSCKRIFFRPPLQSPSALQHLQVLERLAERGWPIPAAGYQLIARKRVVGMTPLRPRWRPRRGLIAGGLIEPTSRNGIT